MALLIETRLNSLRLDENAKPRKGCLGRLEGICADFKNPTRNGRLYKKKLWENVFADPIFQESLKSKTLLGELDHPEDRLEVLAGEACIVMTDYRIDEDEGVIYAGFDILDTPRGKILKSLLDYGCVMGVSSRGQGDISNTSEGEVVDEDSYDFACFDVVTTPAVAKARQNVVESVKKTKTFVESIRRQIDEAETVGDLNAIKKVVESTQTPELDSLMESIQDKCNSIKEGKTITSKNDSELHKSNESTETVTSKAVKESVESNKSKDSAKTIREHKELLKCISDMRKKLSAYKYREEQLSDVIQSKDLKIESLERKLDKFNSVKYTNSVYKKQTESLTKKVSELNRQLDSVNGKLRTTEKLQRDATKESAKNAFNSKRLQESVNTKTHEILDLKSQLKSAKELEKTSTKLNAEYIQLQESAKRKDAEISKLSNTINEKDNKLNVCHDKIHSLSETVRNLESEIESLNEKLHSLQSESITSHIQSERNADQMESEINSYNELIESLQTQLETVKAQRDGFSDNNKKLSTKCKQLSERLSAYQESYVNTKSKQLGIDANSVHKFVNSDTTIGQVNKIVEDLQKTKDRYARLPISENAPSGVVINNSNITPTVDEEEARLTSFIEGIANVR